MIQVEIIRCPCGMIIKGISENQLKSNLRVHKKGNRHKIQMENKDLLKH